MMNLNILNKNPLMFFDRAVNAQRSQLLTVMADAVSECRTAAENPASGTLWSPTVTPFMETPPA